jgi:uroporphyrinogen decarboxylase
MLETAIAELGFGVYFPSPLEDLAEAKRIVAGRGLTCGVLNDIQLLDWSKEEIRAEVTRIIEAGKPGGKFLFATHVMPYAIPEPSIRAMLDAAYEVGQW